MGLLLALARSWTLHIQWFQQAALIAFYGTKIVLLSVVTNTMVSAGLIDVDGRRQLHSCFPVDFVYANSIFGAKLSYIQ